MLGAESSVNSDLCQGFQGAEAEVELSTVSVGLYCGKSQNHSRLYCFGENLSLEGIVTDSVLKIFQYIYFFKVIYKKGIIHLNQ